ncbi:MAG TPA: hypothetical protein VFT29_15330 [Gemmatimonadaceae bacterium]|nr:hypothetical protein [Gemmatimonadaceae bacterium]
MTEHNDVPAELVTNRDGPQRSIGHYITVRYEVGQRNGYERRSGMPFPWIKIEPVESEAPILRVGDEYLGLECREGTTQAEAEALADMLRRHVEVLSYFRLLA